MPRSSKRVGGTPRAEDTRKPAKALTTEGKSAAYCTAPALATLTAKTAAVMGVPKRAEKAALMPHMVSTLPSPGFM